MKRQILTRLLSAGIMTCLGLGLLTGCKEKTVDYSIEGVTENTQTESTVEKGEGKSGVAQFQNEKEWEERWDITVEKGEWGDVTAELIIDAPITVPDTKQMSVVEAVEPEFDAEYKEHIAKRLYGDSEIFYNEKDTYAPVEKYTADEYIGDYEGISYKLIFAEEKGSVNYVHRTKQIIWEPEDWLDVCPERFKKEEDIVCTLWADGNTVENQCELSEKEALKEAKDFVEKLGLDYGVASYSYPLVWGNPKPDKTTLVGYTVDTYSYPLVWGYPPITYSSQIGNMTDKWEADGYVFTFDYGVDDVSFVNFGMGEEYWDFWVYATEEQEWQYSMKVRLQVYVTDKGVIRVCAENPLETTGVSEMVELLPLATIKNIIKEQTTKNWDIFQIDTNYEENVRFDRMELIYFRVRDKENPGHYSYVPTWRLANVTEDKQLHALSIKDPIMINAIDGSVIDFYNET